MSIELSLTNQEIRAGFYALKTPNDLSKLLDVPINHLTYYAYHIKHDKHYTVFTIAKKTGGRRQIVAPSSSLKILQHKINQILQAVYVPKVTVHGFLPEKSILTNARRHLEGRGGKKYVFNVDLENFFPSITTNRVVGLLQAVPYGLPYKVALIIGLISSYKGTLPQGAPSSPIISNMICAKMDTQLKRLAQSKKCVYTRYADDITFSTTLPNFPTALARTDDSSGGLVVGNELEHIIRSNGFTVNEKKVRLLSRYERQDITGLTVNKFPNVRRIYVRQIRAMLHAWDKYGLDAAQKEFEARYSKPNAKGNFKSFKKVLRGKIEFLRMVRGDENQIYLKFINEYARLDPDFKIRQKTLPKVSPKITVRTEGKTDWKHLKAALNHFRSNGEYQDLDIDFWEYENDVGDTKLLKMCELDQANNAFFMHIFDRDVDATTKRVKETDKDYKKWSDKKFSFPLPIPSHRVGTPNISIEFYYQDKDIQQLDTSGRRLFINSEFNSKTGRHNSQKIICSDRNKWSKNNICVIDNDVFDENNTNIALPKNDFAENILNGDFNVEFDEFRLVFNLIRKIIKENAVL